MNSKHLFSVVKQENPEVAPSQQNSQENYQFKPLLAKIKEESEAPSPVPLKKGVNDFGRSRYLFEAQRGNSALRHLIK